MTRTRQELHSEAKLNSTRVLKHATNKMTDSLELKKNQFVLRRPIQQPTPVDFDQWLKEIAEVHERSIDQGRSGINLITVRDTKQPNLISS